MLDVPNERSSHVVPTPRGGGVAFVFSFLIGLLVFRFCGHADSSLRIAMALGGGIVTLVGFRDDRKSLSIRAKFFWHLLASVIALVALGGWSTLALGVLDVRWGWWGFFVGLPFLIWAINLFNFMDGIDGLAISEAVFLALASALVITMAGGSAFESLLLAAACLGFAFLNWPPAKLFMGDAGSGFLGFVYAVIALDSTAALETTVWPWLILPAVFVIDASYTLLCRFLTGQRWYEAHCSHAYQHAARRFNGHRPVTIATQFVNVCWLLPLACAAQHWPRLGALLTFFAWLPLLYLARYFKAGNCKGNAGDPAFREDQRLAAQATASRSAELRA
ncbi:MAG: wbpL [Rhodocyclales bacterium]|nr:wbpL [Rhodocyclales bacterium]